MILIELIYNINIDIIDINKINICASDECIIVLYWTVNASNEYYKTESEIMMTA